MNASPLHYLFSYLLFPLFTVAQDSSCTHEFETKATLREAAVRYVQGGGQEDSIVAKQFGWPIGTWCVGQVTDFSGIFKGERVNGSTEMKFIVSEHALVINLIFSPCLLVFFL